MHVLYRCKIPLPHPFLRSRHLKVPYFHKAPILMFYPTLNLCMFFIGVRSPTHLLLRSMHLKVPYFCKVPILVFYPTLKLCMYFIGVRSPPPTHSLRSRHLKVHYFCKLPVPTLKIYVYVKMFVV